jgi:hypothetical protein
VCHCSLHSFCMGLVRDVTENAPLYQPSVLLGRCLHFGSFERPSPRLPRLPGSLLLCCSSLLSHLPFSKRASAMCSRIFDAHGTALCQLSCRSLALVCLCCLTFLALKCSTQPMRLLIRKAWPSAQRGCSIYHEYSDW